ncbi:hypothetical protein D5R81_01520 [Parashewanella spongiae]|uniref:Uncharacterized protein n=1 Tax=Parashewanella spongiae TaxID=342950 RepID=A0A3A6UND3_9GAMM|nr:hypothetical protein [Parashewanella spongiae]MCL1076774.1 hypothetical protein [Parashewanella spongiae]RJY19301.1 hypothetical protein D5R81_01520 [Parashewanella spongiae]
MLTRTWHFALFTIFLCLSLPTNSKNITKADVIKTSLPFIKQSLNAAPLECLGISKSQLDSTFEQANQTCQSNIPQSMPQHEFEQQLDQFSNCISAGVQQAFDIPDEQVQQCVDLAELRDSEFVESDYDDPKAYLERMTGKLNDALIQHAQLSDTTNIPFPLYPNHKVISHFPDGMGNLSNEKSLPVLVIASNDSFDDVVTFYQKHLTSFPRYNVNDGVIFMEEEVPNFDLLRHFSVYTSTPHVMIEDMRDSPIANKVGGTKVEISYRKKN